MGAHRHDDYHHDIEKIYVNGTDSPFPPSPNINLVAIEISMIFESH